MRRRHVEAIKTSSSKHKEVRPESVIQVLVREEERFGGCKGSCLTNDSFYLFGQFLHRQYVADEFSTRIRQHAARPQTENLKLPLPGTNQDAKIHGLTVEESQK